MIGIRATSPATAPGIRRRLRVGWLDPGSGRPVRSIAVFAKMPWLTKFCTLWLVLLILVAALADLIPGLADPQLPGLHFR